MVGVQVPLSSLPPEQRSGPPSYQSTSSPAALSWKHLDVHPSASHALGSPGGDGRWLTCSLCSTTIPTPPAASPLLLLVGLREGRSGQEEGGKHLLQVSAVVWKQESLGTDWLLVCPLGVSQSLTQSVTWAPVPEAPTETPHLLQPSLPLILTNSSEKRISRLRPPACLGTGCVISGKSLHS